MPSELHHPKEMLHMYVGRHYGKTLSSLLTYIEGCLARTKAGYMSLYCSHLTHCGGMRCSDDEGIFTMVHLEDSLFSKNGFGACVRVVGRGEWSVRALRRIDPQTRLRDLDVSGYIAADETP